MSADFNRKPYYDDYDENKNFHRILFRPGYAVQARELTQLQTILQEQISRHGDHVFKNGSLVIPGAVKVIGDSTYIRLQDPSLATQDVDNYEGARIENESGNAVAAITTVTDSNDNDPLTLYISYTTGTHFSRNENLTITRNDNSVLENVKTEDAEDYTGQSTIVIVERGVYFLLDQFVLVQNQKLVVSKYTSIDNIPDEQSIGLVAKESFVTPEKDASLLDNAQGSTNQTAPGAHRYKIEATLALKSEVDDLKYFNEIARIVRGEVAKEVRESEYDVLGDTLAKRTYEESGDYVIRDFNIGIDEHPTDSSKIRAVLDAGKAYVRGYRVETTVPTRLEIDKARSTEESGNTLVPLQQGDYFHVKSLFGHPEYFTTVNLYSDSALTYTNDNPDEPSNQIGTATVRAVMYDPAESALENETVVKVHLFNFSFTGTNTIADVKTLFSNTGTIPFAGKIAPGSIVNGSSVLQEQGDSTPIYQLPFSEVSSVNYSEFNFIKKYESVVSTSGVTVSNVVSSEQFRDETSDFIVYVKNIVSGSTASSVIGSVGTPDFVTLSSDNKTATLDVSSFGVNDTDEVVVYVTTFKSPANIRTKTPVVGSTVITSATPGNVIDLGKADVYKVTSIIGNSGDDYTQSYSLDNGQRDTFYGISKLNLRAGYFNPAEVLTVTFDYYNHSTGDFFVVDSYDSISYENIPTYTSESGNKYRLANCIDLRPTENSSGGISASNPSAYVPDSEATLDFEYYLPRKDKIVVSSDGIFSVVEGIPDLDPEEPSNITNGITLYNVDVDAYTFNKNEISVSAVNHPRYRMEDIGELENRIRNLEYYTTLNSSEKELLEEEFDGKFKTSVLVDWFANHKVGNAQSALYRAAVDPIKGELRPESSTKSIPLANDGTGSGYQVTGNVITLPYQETSIINQNKAAAVQTIHPFVKYNWNGSLVLNPNSDSWVSTRRVPDTTRDSGTEFTEAFENNENSLGTVWGNWNTFWRGNRQMRTRTGTRTSRTESTEIERIGDRVINRSAVPFMRSRVIEFDAKGLKPLTEVKPYFDNVDVSPFVKPDGGSPGDTLITDGTGRVSGQFEIPNREDVRFRTGTREFELKDSGENPSTTGVANYSAQGVLEDVSETFISTTIVDIESTSLSATNATGRRRNPTPPPPVTLEPDPEPESVDLSNDIVKTVFTQPEPLKPKKLVAPVSKKARPVPAPIFRSRYIDPLAQSFLITMNGGTFLTSIDLYFGPSAKDNQFPVTIQIRAMENGFPAPEVAPYSTVTLDANELGNGSNDGSVPTRFSFDSPVYLEQGVEYCFVVFTDSDTLNVWKSILGKRDVLTGEQIARQPYLGSLFKSQNNKTWTPAQQEDLKFVINRAEFDTSVNGLVTFTNQVRSTDQGTEADPYIDQLPSDPFEFTNGSNYIRVNHPSHSMVEGDTVRFTLSSSSDLSGPLAGIPESELIDTDLTVSKGPSGELVGVSSYYVVVTTNSNKTTSLGGLGILATSHVSFSVVHPVVEQVILPDTSVSWEFKGTSKYSKNTDASFRNFKIGDDNRLAFSRTSMASNDSSVVLRANLSSNFDNLSPYIDTKRFALLATENRVNGIQDIDLEADSDNSAARYITKPIELTNPANEVRIYFEANRPPEASIDVFVKVAPVGSNTQFLDQVWEKITLNESIPPNEKNDSFSRYAYAKEFVNDFNVYGIKVVMRSANEARVPRIRDLRAISVKG